MSLRSKVAKAPLLLLRRGSSKVRNAVATPPPGPQPVGGQSGNCPPRHFHKRMYLLGTPTSYIIFAPPPRKYQLVVALTTTIAKTFAAEPSSLKLFTFTALVRI